MLVTSSKHGEWHDKKRQTPTHHRRRHRRASQPARHPRPSWHQGPCHRLTLLLFFLQHLRGKTTKIKTKKDAKQQMSGGEVSVVLRCTHRHARITAQLQLISEIFLRKQPQSQSSHQVFRSLSNPAKYALGSGSWSLRDGRAAFPSVLLGSGDGSWSVCFRQRKISVRLFAKHSTNPTKHQPAINLHNWLETGNGEEERNGTTITRQETG